MHAGGRTGNSGHYRTMREGESGTFKGIRGNETAPKAELRAQSESLVVGPGTARLVKRHLKELVKCFVQGWGREGEAYAGFSAALLGGLVGCVRWEQERKAARKMLEGIVHGLVQEGGLREDTEGSIPSRMRESLKRLVGQMDAQEVVVIADDNLRGCGAMDEHGAAMVSTDLCLCFRLQINLCLCFRLQMIESVGP